MQEAHAFSPFFASSRLGCIPSLQNCKDAFSRCLDMLQHAVNKLIKNMHRHLTNRWLLPKLDKQLHALLDIRQTFRQLTETQGAKRTMYFLTALLAHANQAVLHIFKVPYTNVLIDPFNCEN
mmetsp:Transcript_137035/g.238242  ORF Transcript_137035/g.238242 Transcript_137035/m.238242 type:complete len:122 (-) Transcript_137035:7655-8020(-)